LMGKSGPLYNDESDEDGIDGYESGMGVMVIGAMMQGAEDDGGKVAAIMKLAGCMESEMYGE
jgi:hypothetical protein